MAQGILRSRIETAVVVTLITVLVWLYAEGESVKSYTNQSVRYRFVTGDGVDVQVRPSGDETALIAFRGSSGQLQALGAKLGHGPIEVQVVDRSAQGTPTQTINLKEKLNTALADLGIEITSVDPEFTQVTVQRMEQVELPVTVTLPEAPLIAPTYKVKPDKLTLRLPVTLAEQVTGLSLSARLDQVEQLSQLPPNVAHTRSVALVLPTELAGQGVTLPRPNVEVTFTIQRQTETYVAPTVPIHINAPPLLLKRYDIDLPADKLVLADVQLSGPKEAVADIKSGKVKIWAEIQPSADDLEAQLRPDAEPMKLHLRVPPGVSVDSPLPSVDLTVKRREE